ncbi:hypothetical protein RZS08_28215, partial [Arthrospira platensis SPKY1]|nr:hypothetical protein [Arthrospira platensis SPKY1]
MEDDLQWTPALLGLGIELGIRQVIPQRDGSWLLATHRGIMQASARFEDIAEVVVGSALESVLGTSSVWYIQQQGDGSRYWLVMENAGLALWDAEMGQVSSVAERSTGISSSIFFQILEGQDGILWITSYTQGLVRYDP